MWLVKTAKRLGKEKERPTDYTDFTDFKSGDVRDFCWGGGLGWLVPSEARFKAIHGTLGRGLPVRSRPQKKPTTPDPGKQFASS